MKASTFIPSNSREGVEVEVEEEGEEIEETEMAAETLELMMTTKAGERTLTNQMLNVIGVINLVTISLTVTLGCLVTRMRSQFFLKAMKLRSC